MNPTPEPVTARAVIAEDEPVLASALASALTAAWPELAIDAVAGDGDSALRAVLQHQPELAFLDIRMPGMSGLDVAQAIAEDWPHAKAPPLLVFVTAYDVHAVQAFDLAAADYLVKPVRPDRLALTVSRLRATLAQRLPRDESLLRLATALGPLLGQLELSSAVTRQPLRMLAAGVGNTVRMIPVGDVIYLQATDKYVNVVCADTEALVRTSLSSLAPQLDDRFRRIHRSTIVNMDHVEAAVRDDAGRLRLCLRARAERLLVSRLHTDIFRPM
nr:response regulator transcription factor [Pseudomonas sp.]